MLTKKDATEKGKGANSAAEGGSVTLKMKIDKEEGEGPKLSLKDKRKIAYEWFVDPERSDISTFCSQVKNAPTARGFVRKASKQLNLAPLRKRRLEDKDIDGQVLEKIMNFRPNKAAAVTEAADVEAAKKLLIAFFDDEEATPLPRFLRKHNAPHLIPVARQLRLKGRRERCREKNHKIRERVMADIEKACDKLNVSPLLVSNTSNLATNLSMDDPHTAKALLIEWFDDANHLSILDFLKEKDKASARSSLKPIRQIAKAAKLFHLRKSRDDADVREKAMKRIDELFEPYLKDHIIDHDEKDDVNEKKGIAKKNEQPKKRPRTLKQQSAATKSTDNNNMKTLLKEWFDNEDMIPLGKFLRKRNQFHLKEEMLSLIRQNRLPKLRSNRDDPKKHALAMKRIERISSREQSKNSGDAARLADMVKNLLKEWFDSEEQMLPLGKFLRKRNQIHLKDVVLSLVRQNRLQKLRRERDDPKIHALAMKRINRASLREEDCKDTLIALSDEAAIADGKKIKKQGPTRSVQGVVKVYGLTVEASDQDSVRSHLKGWFCDGSCTSLSDYLEAKGRSDLLPVMKRLVRRLGLSQLRQEHHMICKKANKKIDGVFKAEAKKKKNGPNESDSAALKEEDEMPAPSAPPLDEGAMCDGFVDVVAADISKKMDIREKENLTVAAPMDMDDDESDYVPIAETAIVDKNLVNGK